SSWHLRARAVSAPFTVFFKARGRSAWLKPYGRWSLYVGGITPARLKVSDSANFSRLDPEQTMAGRSRATSCAPSQSRSHSRCPVAKAGRGENHAPAFRGTTQVPFMGRPLESHPAAAARSA